MLKIEKYGLKSTPRIMCMHIQGVLYRRMQLACILLATCMQGVDAGMQGVDARMLGLDAENMHMHSNRAGPTRA